jgi:WD40 repeat protein
MKAGFSKRLSGHRALVAALTLFVALSVGFYWLNVTQRRAYKPLQTMAMPSWRGRTVSSISGIAFSPDGKILAAADNFNRMLLINVATGKARQMAQGTAAESLAWSRDGKNLAEAFGSRLQVWDVEKGVLQHEIEAVHDKDAGAGYRNQHINCYVSPDATLGAAAQWQDAVTIWELKTVKRLLHMKAGHTNPAKRSEIQGLAFADDSRQVAVARLLLDTRGKENAVSDVAGTGRSAGHEITIYDPRSGKPLRVLSWNEANVLRNRGEIGICFSPDNTLLAATEGHVIQVWSMLNGKVVRTLQTSTAANFHSSRQFIEFSPDGKMVAQSGLNGEVSLWSVLAGNLLQLFYHSQLRDLAFSPDGKLLATSGGDGQGVIKLWDVSTL